MNRLFFWRASHNRLRLLYLDAQNLTVYRWQTGELQHEVDFTVEKEGTAEFAAYLAKNRKCCFSMLTDVVDEGFQIETLPPLRGRDRAALLSRKLAQHFQGTQFVAALSLGRESSGRRDERILLAALTRPQTISPWLAALRQQECRFNGLYSMALLADRFVANHPGDFSRKYPQFLLLVQMRAGLRQIFFENGRLQFSRLSTWPSLTNGDPEKIAAACIAESTRMRQYLLSQRKLSREVSLSVLLLIDSAAAGHLRNVGSNSEGLHYESIGISTMTNFRSLRKSRLAAPFQGEHLFMPLLKKSPPRQQFAPAEERLFHRVWQMRRMLDGAGLTILFVCLLFSTGRWNEAVDLSAQTSLVRQQTADNQKQDARTFGIQPVLPPGSANLHALIDSYDDVIRHSSVPQDAYAILSGALNQFAQIRLERIDWHTGSEEAAAGHGATSDDATVTADVYGDFPLIHGDDDRATQMAIEQFVDALSKNTGVQVSILKLPDQLEAIGTLSDPIGSTRNGAANLQAPKFSIRLRVKSTVS